ncbi:MAG: outer membrane beta-barrel protein [Halobacteriovoraceae bacterium]|nr:outer membrane beta-barrel protein [Halobacteriovoraceae bacterium]
MQKNFLNDNKSLTAKIFVGLFLCLFLSTGYAQKEKGEDLSGQFKQVDTDAKKENNKPQGRKAAPSPPPPSTTNAPFNRHGVSLGFGQSFLFGNYSNSGEDRLTFDYYYIYRASYTFQFLLNIHSHKFEQTNEYVKVSSLNMGIKAKLFDFDAFSPYITGGLGFYQPKARRYVDGEYVETETKSVMGINVGAGMDLELNEHFTVGLLLHLHDPFKAKYDNQPSLTGQYVKLLMTVAYFF